MSYFTQEATRKWWILAAMSICLAMAFIDQTAISVTLPNLQRTFKTSATAVQWVVDIYLLSIAVLVVIGGRLGDIFQHRRLYLLGLSLFMLASVCCAVAPNILFLIFSRALQGVGAALFIPSATVLTLNAFAQHERGRAMGRCVGYASFFLILGPVLGGLFTQWLSWRFIFWLNVPLCSIALLIIYQAASAQPKPNPGLLHQLDWAGFFTFFLAISTSVFALMEGANFGWDSALIVSAFSAAAILSLLFYRQQKRAEHPLIDLQIFNNKIFCGSALIYFCIQLVMMNTVFGALFSQIVLGFNPAIAGFLSLPGTLPVLFMSRIAGSLLDKYGVRRPVVSGLLLVLIGLLWNALMVYKQNYFYLIPGLLCTGFGIPLIMSPLGTAAVSSVAQAQQGVASGMLNAARQLGSCIGLASLSAIIMGYHHYRLKYFLLVNQQNYPHFSLQQFTDILIHPAGAQLAPLQIIAKASFTAAYSLGLITAASFTFMALLLAWYWLKPVENLDNQKSDL